MVKFLDHVEVGFVEIVANMGYYSFFYVEIFCYQEFVKSPSEFWVFSVVLCVRYIGDSISILVFLPVDVNEATSIIPVSVMFNCFCPLVLVYISILI